MLGGIGLAEGVINVLDFLGGQVITHFAIIDAFDKTHDEQIMGRTHMMQHGGEGSAVDLLKATTEGIVAFITLLTGLEEFLQGTDRALTRLKLTGEAIENGLDGDGVIVVCKVDIRDDVRGVGAETGLQVCFHLSGGPILGASDVLEVTGMLHPSLWGGIRHGFEGSSFSTPSPLIALDSMERFE